MKFTDDELDQIAKIMREHDSRKRTNTVLLLTLLAVSTAGAILMWLPTIYRFGMWLASKVPF